jgi:hypothetical protein
MSKQADRFVGRWAASANFCTLEGNAAHAEAAMAEPMENREECGELRDNDTDP